MTDSDPRGGPPPGAPLNREQRRAERFGAADRAQDNLLPESANNPASGAGGGGEGDDSASYAGRPDQDVTRLTGAGTGGATESDDRLTHHEGVHLGNQPNS
jgi:hypothetical protein